MEHNIGKIIRFPNGRAAEVVLNNGASCDGCIFEWHSCGDFMDFGIKGHCMALTRSDKKNIIYKEIKES